MAQYIKRPIQVEAIKYDGSSKSIQEIQAMAEKCGRRVEWKRNKLLIHTDEGTMEAKKGDYIIQGVKGEVYPCASDVFIKTYDPA
jgi:hypothetical protein